MLSPSFSIGNTPLVKNLSLNKQLPLPKLYLKLEENNPTNSHKIRSAFHQLKLVKEWIFAISSTGNAAISTNYVANKKKLKIITFITPNISSEKLNKLKKIAPYLIISEKPYRMLSYLQHRYKIRPLNSILDEHSIKSYEKIGAEIFKQKQEVKNIFIFISSGSTFLGIAQYFLELKKKGKIKKLPKLFATFLPRTNLKGVYKSTILLNQDYKLDFFENRKNKIKEVLKVFKGKIVKISDKELLDARAVLSENKQDTSPEGCANFAAVMKKKRLIKNQNTVCLLTGKSDQWEGISSKKYQIIKLPVAENINDLDQILKSFKIIPKNL